MASWTGPHWGGLQLGNYESYSRLDNYESIPDWSPGMGRTALGELEHLILIAIVRLGENAYGAAVIDEIESRTGRDLSHAAVYVALQRLEAKEMLTGRDGEPGPDRGGRPRRYFTPTVEGLGKLEESSRAIFAMWDGMEAPARGKGR